MEQKGYDDCDEWNELSKETLQAIGFKEGHAAKFIKKVEAKFGKSEDNDRDDMKMPQVVQGSKPKKKKRVSIVFLGQTGVGKTTLLCSIADYMNNTPFEKIHGTPKCAVLGESQTQSCDAKVYKNDEFEVTIIDTPGIGDTQGPQKDKEHVDGIMRFLSDFSEFNAIAIVLARGTTRADPKMRYIIGEIKANLPKDAANNFIVALTRSDSVLPDADTVAVVKKLGLPVSNIYMVNNKAYEELHADESLDTQSRAKLLKRANKANKVAYLSNFENIHTLLEEASEFNLYKGDKIRQLQLKRNELNNQVWKCRTLIDDSFNQEKQINDRKYKLKLAKKNKLVFSNHTYEKEIEYEDFETKQGLIRTVCSVCGAKNSCHNPCGLSYGDNIEWCAAIGSDGKCSCGHSAAYHSHTYNFPVKKTRTLKKVDYKAKAKHEAALADEAKYDKEIAQLDGELRNIVKKREKQIELIQQSYKELEEMAIIGYNDSFESYVQQCKDAVNVDVDIPEEQKKAKIDMFNQTLTLFNTFKDALKNQVNDRVGSAARWLGFGQKIKTGN